MASLFRRLRRERQREQFRAHRRASIQERTSNRESLAKVLLAWATLAAKVAALIGVLFAIYKVVLASKSTSFEVRELPSSALEPAVDRAPLQIAYTPKTPFACPEIESEIQMVESLADPDTPRCAVLIEVLVNSNIGGGNPHCQRSLAERIRELRKDCPGLPQSPDSVQEEGSGSGPHGSLDLDLDDGEDGVLSSQFPSWVGDDSFFALSLARSYDSATEIATAPPVDPEAADVAYTDWNGDGLVDVVRFVTETPGLGQKNMVDGAVVARVGQDEILTQTQTTADPAPNAAIYDSFDTRVASDLALVEPTSLRTVTATPEVVYRYNDLSGVWEVIDEQTGMTQHEYDANGNLINGVENIEALAHYLDQMQSQADNASLRAARYIEAALETEIGSLAGLSAVTDQTVADSCGSFETPGDEPKARVPDWGGGLQLWDAMRTQFPIGAPLLARGALLDQLKDDALFAANPIPSSTTAASYCSSRGPTSLAMRMARSRAERAHELSGFVNPAMGRWYPTVAALTPANAVTPPGFVFSGLSGKAPRYRSAVLRVGSAMLAVSQRLPDGTVSQTDHQAWRHAVTYPAMGAMGLNAVGATEAIELAPRKTILSVGLDYRSVPRVRPLEYASVDAFRVAETFAGLGYQSRTLGDGDAHASSLLAAIGDEMRSSHARDTLILYFSGHGVSDSSGQVALLFPAGSTAEVLPLSVVMDALADYPGDVTVIVDGCTEELEGLPALHRSMERHRGQRRILFGTGIGKVAIESPSLGSGLFTHALLDYLDRLTTTNASTETRLPPGDLDFRALFRAVATDTAAISRSQYGIDQAPVLLETPRLSATML